MPKIYCQITAVRSNWYIAHLTLNGAQSLGYGRTRVQALQDAINRP